MGLLELIFVLGLVAVTTLVFYTAAKMIGLRPAGSMLCAFRALLDWAGMFVMFFAANLALGFAAVLLARSITVPFVEFYNLESLLLIVLSAAQAFVFQVWWKRD